MVVRFRSFGQLFNDLLRRLFCADEQDMSPFGSSFAEEVGGLANLLGGARKIDDIDSVAGTENELLHLGVPFVGAMSKVYSCFEETFHLCFSCQHIRFSCPFMIPQLRNFPF
jgi:hypothetical protein